MSDNVRVYVGDGGGELGLIFDSILEQHCIEQTEKLVMSIDENSDLAVTELKSTSPRGHSRRKVYQRGWKKDRERIDRGLGGVRVIIHNKNKPTLTHLLENGHRVVRGGSLLSGGHVVGHARAFPHIKKAQERALRRILGGV